MIGSRIQEILDKKGMTQAELAEKTDMSLAHVNRIINGKSEPDKTVAGGLLLGPVGLLSGFIGSGQVTLSCLRCGNRWKAGM